MGAGVARFPTPHVARVLRYPEGGVVFIEGEPGDGPEPEPGAPFACYLFLPLGQEDAAPRGRKITRPQVMFDPAEMAGGEAAPSADDELLILAPELASSYRREAAWPGWGRWQVDGAPQPFGPPGVQVIGVLANVSAVGD